jgi:hypothetical protein
VNKLNSNKWYGWILIINLIILLWPILDGIDNLYNCRIWKFVISFASKNMAMSGIWEGLVGRDMHLGMRKILNWCIYQVREIGLKWKIGIKLKLRTTLIVITIGKAK